MLELRGAVEALGVVGAEDEEEGELEGTAGISDHELGECADL